MTSGLLRTSDIAKALGIRVNTVMNYEKWGYLPEIPRDENGYRVFMDERVNEINQRFREDGYDVALPEQQHARTFYLEAPGGFTVEVLS